MNAGNAGVLHFLPLFPTLYDLYGQKASSTLGLSYSELDNMADFSFNLLESSRWTDYALLDSGDGLKLERFGKYIFVRPESQAMWSRALPESDWNNVHAVFQPTG